jgi:hypothetical protein
MLEQKRKDRFRADMKLSWHRSCQGCKAHRWRRPESNPQCRLGYKIADFDKPQEKCLKPMTEYERLNAMWSDRYKQYKPRWYKEYEENEED